MCDECNFLFLVYYYLFVVNYYLHYYLLFILTCIAYLLFITTCITICCLFLLDYYFWRAWAAGNHRELGTIENFGGVPGQLPHPC